MQWQHGKFAGLGMERFADGALYVGEYEEGVAQGLGICLFLNGDSYEVSTFRPPPPVFPPPFSASSNVCGRLAGVLLLIPDGA